MRTLWLTHDRARSRRALLMSAMAGGLTVLAGCGGGDDAPEPTPEQVDPTQEPTPAPVAALGPVVWATSLDVDGAPGTVITTFWREETVIYAVVEAENLGSGDVITATWTINGHPIDGADATIRIDDAAAQGWLAFSLAWSGQELWPTGELGVTVSAPSGATTSGSIRIVSNQ